MNTEDRIPALGAAIDQDISNATSLEDLEQIRVKALGKKGQITQILKGLDKLSLEERRALGGATNKLKTHLEARILEARAQIIQAQLQARAASEHADVSLPPGLQNLGRLHPIQQTIDEVIAIFANMDFEVVEGPDIEDDFHNFSALNFPQDHPARQMFDTFYLQGDLKANILRTHTSPVQIRTMESTQPPIRVLCPGRTYRSDSDITHTPMFHQVEGLVIDEHTHMGHLKGCLHNFCQAYFELEHIPLRFRPSHFPFTEPSAEVDIACSREADSLTIGTGDAWLEILGCGMVHPAVLKACGYDPDIVQGFAFGVGIERIAMLKYNIPDLRTFFESDIRWLHHYGFLPLEAASLARGLVP